METEETNTTEAPEIHYREFQIKMEEEWWEAGAKLLRAIFNPRIFVQVMDDQVPYTNTKYRKRGPREQGLPNRSPCRRDDVEKMQLWSGNEGVYP